MRLLHPGPLRRAEDGTRLLARAFLEDGDEGVGVAHTRGRCGDLEGLGRPLPDAERDDVAHHVDVGGAPPAILAAAAAPLYAMLKYGGIAQTFVVLLLALGLIAKHWGNVQRLLAGQESRIGSKKKG